MWMWSTGINRNIVECKVYHTHKDEKGNLGINRNIVECKDVRWVRKGRINGVLIETLWNVKQGQYQNMAQFPNRINRNIVECKELKSMELGTVLCRY